MINTDRKDTIYMQRLNFLRFIICLLWFGVTAEAGVHIVPDDKASIQEAIDLAADFDTVLVFPGTYTEHIDFTGKSIVVTSSGGSSETVLRPEDANVSLVTINSGEGEGTQFSGFTLTGVLNAHALTIGNQAVPQISHNVFYENIGAGISDKAVILCASDSGQTVITRNIFYDNLGIGCVWILSGKTSVYNNTFVGNLTAVTSLSATCEVRNNIATGCLATAMDGSYGVLDYNCWWNNYKDYG